MPDGRPGRRRVARRETDQLSGGDLDSAAAFAADDRTDACAELSATDASKGTFSDAERSCTARSTSEGVATTILISDVSESHGALRIEMSTPEASADDAEAAVNAVLAAVKGSFATSG